MEGIVSPKSILFKMAVVALLVSSSGCAVYAPMPYGYGDGYGGYGEYYGPSYYGSPVYVVPPPVYFGGRGGGHGYGGWGRGFRHRW